MGVVKQYVSGRCVTCRDDILGVFPIMVHESNPHGDHVCPRSVRDLGEDFIRKNLPKGVEYDPNFKCEVENCPYR